MAKVITTRRYQERLDTLERVRAAGMAVCCGGIIGMGESREDRVKLLVTLANLPEPPQSVPINALVPIRGNARLATSFLTITDAKLDEFEFVRTIAVARHHHAAIGDPAVGRPRILKRKQPGACAFLPAPVRSSLATSS